MKPAPRRMPAASSMVACLDLEAGGAEAVEARAIQFLDQASMMDDADARGEAIDLGEDVAGHEDRDAPRVRQGTQQLSNLHHAGRIQAIDRLIQDHELRIMQHGASQAETLQVAGRKGAGLPVCVGRQGKEVEHRSVEAASLTPCRRLAISRFSQESVEDTRRWIRPSAHTRPWTGATWPDGVPENSHCPGRRSEHAQQEPDGGGLPGAIEADEAVDLAGPKEQIHALHGVHIAVGLGEAMGFDGVLHVLTVCVRPQWPMSRPIVPRCVLVKLSACFRP